MEEGEVCIKVLVCNLSLTVFRGFFNLKILLSQAYFLQLQSLEMYYLFLTFIWSKVMEVY